MSVLAIIFFGVAIGATMYLFDPHPAKSGFLGAAFLGIVGALVGNLFHIILTTNGVISAPSALLIPAFGALMLLSIKKAVSGFE